MGKWYVVTLCVMMLAGTGRADEPLTLAKKAALFEYDMQQRFVLDGQALCKLKTPTETRPFVAYNMPDNAYMTGIYLGALAMQYAVTKDPDVRAKAGASIRALNLLSTVSGKKGLLARAAWPLDRPFDDDGLWRKSPDGTHTWRGDISSDQMAGVFYGYALAYDLVANADEKRHIAMRVAELTDHVLEKGLRIIGYDGKTTTWGKYYPEYVKGVEKLNALLFLQLLKVAQHVTGEERFAQAYQRWAADEAYAEIAVKTRRMADPSRRGMINHSDDVLLFLGYYPLLEYEKDPELRRCCADSLRRTWNGTEKFPGVKPEHNPFYAFAVYRFLGDESGVAGGIETLRWFPLNMKWNHATIAAYEEKFGFTLDPMPASPRPKRGEAVPVDRRAKSWSAWVMDPYAPGADRSEDSAMEFNGHDYLMAYWLGRYTGIITPAM